ncbi:TolB family protein [Ilumatobacter sp.]|uniref:TolB family protein n=1 Tax=Ilumatobacter sp. TaxID=1967498 RepID=UPI003AF6E433
MAGDVPGPAARVQAGSAERTGASGARYGAWVGARLADGRVVRLSPDDGFHYQACVRPDGLDALFSGAASGPPRIWSVTIDPAGAPVALTPTDSGARHPAWSWSGDRIAFTSDRATPGAPQHVEDISPQGTPDSGNIFVMAPDGSRVEQLTGGAVADQRPTFSPDGSTVVFVSNREDRIGLWSVPSDGSEPPTPLPYRGFAYRPWFGVDGTTVYCFTIDGDRHRVARIGLDDDDLELLANDDRGWTHGPFADPNGQVLIAHSTRVDGRYRLFEIPLDGSPMCEITVDGVEHPMHGTRSRNGVITFDVAD